MKLRSSQLCRRSTQWTVNHSTRNSTLAPEMHCTCFLFPFSCSMQTRWPCAVWSECYTKVMIRLLPLNLKSWPLQYTATYPTAKSVQNAEGRRQSKEWDPLNLKSVVPDTEWRNRKKSTMWNVRVSLGKINPTSVIELRCSQLCIKSLSER